MINYTMHKKYCREKTESSIFSEFLSSIGHAKKYHQGKEVLAPD